MCKAFCEAVAAGTAPQGAARSLAADGFVKADFRCNPKVGDGNKPLPFSYEHLGLILDVTPKLGTDTKHYLMIPIEQIIKILSPK